MVDVLALLMKRQRDASAADTPFAFGENFLFFCHQLGVLVRYSKPLDVAVIGYAGKLCSVTLDVSGVADIRNSPWHRKHPSLFTVYHTV